MHYNSTGNPTHHTHTAYQRRRGIKKKRKKNRKKDGSFVVFLPLSPPPPPPTSLWRDGVVFLVFVCFFGLWVRVPTLEVHFISLSLTDDSVAIYGHWLCPASVLEAASPGLAQFIHGSLPPLSINAGVRLPGTHTPSIAFWHLPPDSARFSYATEGALFISAQLSTDAVSALRKVPVLI